MQKIAIIQISEAGAHAAQQIRQATAGEVISRADVPARWHDFDAFVFIGAMGICVRTIAPLVDDKHSDPAVLCLDTLGQHVIPVLSGHIGGANALAEALAVQLGAQAVITTQSDLAGIWALDTLGQRFGWHKLPSADENRVIFAFVGRRPVALVLGVRDEGTDYLTSTCPPHVTIFDEADWREECADRFEAVIFVSYRHLDSPSGLPCLHYVPKVLTVGIGLAHEAQPARAICDEIFADLRERQNLMPEAVRAFATIDLKASEPVVRLLQAEGYPFTFYSAEQLASVAVPTPSDTVARHVGTPSVSEAAALLGSNGGKLIISKQKGEKWTYAVGRTPSPLPLKGEGGHRQEGKTPSPLPLKGEGGHLQEERTSQKHQEEKASKNLQEERSSNGQDIPLSPSEGERGGGLGFIEIVGAGPGDPDLISVRGRRFLEQADLILYAGSLVPKALTECHKAGAVVRSSADMNLEEQCALMKEHYDRGHLIVRLHTGDPCIFGAIQEQMAFFDREGMRYHITPGISSFLAAAAELRSQFTIPERTQTIILTRGEGRTPMPEREKLHLLARSQSTMCIFLSAAIVDDVQRELLQEYPETTPVAACYHLTWPDQHIYRGVLRDLARIVHDNHLTLTTMLVVGEAIDNRAGLSELYNRHFTHLFRKGSEE
ncbi:MAG: precorrin-4 C(11)-methyltransferase [Bacteroidaceae bacterium]|nr:precorrin-4 C(11)-methyltransferase [Bacteroidaceae bacterium]